MIRRDNSEKREGSRPQRSFDRNNGRSGGRTSDSSSSYERGDRKPFDRDRKPFDGERKPFDRDRKPFGRDENRGGSFERGDRRPFDRDRKPFEGGERRPFDRDRKPFEGGERRPFDRDRKPFEGGERRPFDRDRKPFEGGERRSFDRDRKPFGRDENRGGGFDRGERKPFDRDRKPFGRDENRGGGFDRGERKPFDRDRKPFGRDENRGGGFDRGERKPFDRDRKPFGRDENRGGGFDRGERRPFDGERKPFDRDRKPFEGGERRPFDRDRKPFGRDENRGGGFDRGERKPFVRRDDRDDRKSFSQSSSPSFGDVDMVTDELDIDKKPFSRTERRGGFDKREKRELPSSLPPKDETFWNDKNVEKGMRLNRYISISGICSRREADVYIETGVVSINGEIITQLGTRVMPGDVVCFGEQKLVAEKKQYFLMNKPKGYITTTDDPDQRKTVMSLIDGACKERVYPVGRLDRNTTGLLLFTNDGEMAKKLTHPANGVMKLYHVHLDKNLTKVDMNKIAKGIELEDGVAIVDKIEYTGNGEDKKDLGVEIHIGKNRIVRRIFESLGYDVVKLDRVLFGGLTKKNLNRGRWRPLTDDEINFLRMV